ncbi:MAG: hypothetical protein EOP45_15500 [Sphingobacteriaceae bacterium]|nr:MAG: hypothetical protein EOP45_15500 [Sphingobacteriaceae bacterium]
MLSKVFHVFLLLLISFALYQFVSATWNIFHLRFLSTYQIRQMPHISPSTVHGGDILLMRWRNKSTSKWISWFSHVALVIEKEGLKYTIELNPEFCELQQSHVTISTLDTFLKTYDGIVCARRLKTQLTSAQQTHLYETALEYKSVTYNPSLLVRYIQSKTNFFGSVPHIIDSEIPQNCVELVVSILNRKKKSGGSNRKSTRDLPLKTLNH